MKPHKLILKGLYQYLKNIDETEKLLLISQLQKNKRKFWQPQPIIDIYVNEKRALINYTFLDILTVDVNDNVYRGGEFSKEHLSVLKLFMKEKGLNPECIYTS